MNERWKLDRRSWTGLLDGKALNRATGRKKELCRSEHADH